MRYSQLLVSPYPWQILLFHLAFEALGVAACLQLTARYCSYYLMVVFPYYDAHGYCYCDDIDHGHLAHVPCHGPCYALFSVHSLSHALALPPANDYQLRISNMMQH